MVTMRCCGDRGGTTTTRQRVTLKAVVECMGKHFIGGASLWLWVLVAQHYGATAKKNCIYGHTCQKVPDPVRSPKSNWQWHSQYCDGGPRGNTMCCSFLQFFCGRGCDLRASGGCGDALDHDAARVHMCVGQGVRPVGRACFCVAGRGVLGCSGGAVEHVRRVCRARHGLDVGARVSGRRCVCGPAAKTSAKS
jgi:hypothetical protein